MTSARTPAENDAHRKGLNQRIVDLENTLREYLDVYKEQVEDNPTADIQTNVAFVLKQTNKKIDEYRHTYADVFSDKDSEKINYLIEKFKSYSNKITATQQATKQVTITNRALRKHTIDTIIQNYITTRDQSYTHRHLVRLHRQPPVAVIIDRFNDLKLELATFAQDAAIDNDSLELAFMRTEHHFPSANLMPLLKEIKSKVYHQNVVPNPPSDNAADLYAKIAILAKHGSELMQSKNAKKRAYGQFTVDLASSIASSAHELFDNKKIAAYQKENLQDKIVDLLTNDAIVNNAHRAKLGKILRDILIGFALLIPLGIPAIIYKVKTGNNPFRFFSDHPTKRQSLIADVKSEFTRIVVK